MDKRMIALRNLVNRKSTNKIKDIIFIEGTTYLVNFENELSTNDLIMVGNIANSLVMELSWFNVKNNNQSIHCKVSDKI